MSPLSPEYRKRAVCAWREQRRCARCGKQLDGIPASLHHRRLRSHPFAGLHEVSNLIWLCGTGTTGCHGWVHAHPSLAEEHGYIVHAWEDPRKIPIDHAIYGKCWLWDDGTVGNTPEPKKAE